MAAVQRRRIDKCLVVVVGVVTGVLLAPANCLMGAGESSFGRRRQRDSRLHSSIAEKPARTPKLAAQVKSNNSVIMKVPTVPSAPVRPSSQATNGGGQVFKRRKDEYQWLSWLYHQWSSAPVGQLEESILKHVLPAMDAYAKKRTVRAAEHAEALLDCCVEEYLAGNAHAILNVTIFNAAIDAYAQVGQPDSAQRIIRRMVQLGRENDQLVHLKPDIISLTSLANAWAKSHRDQASSKAEAVLNYAEHTGQQPTTYLYNAVLSALAESTDHDKIPRAEALVKRMHQRTAAGHVECAPSIYTYQTLISVYSKTRSQGGAIKAENILRYLDKLAKPELAPNSHVFASVIRAYAYSANEPAKAEKAYKLLSEMRWRYEFDGQKQCRPNTVVFTSAINACAKPARESERMRTFAVCQLVMEELVDSPYGDPNFLTFAAYLQAIASTLDHGEMRDAETERIFKQCCEAGQAGQIVVQKLRAAASPELYETLLESVDDVERLPLSWTQNVRGERHKSRT